MKVFWLEREKLIEALKEEAERLGRENPNVKKIVLFGSLAEGRAIPGSDADLLIVLTESDSPFLERLAEWSAKMKIDFPVEVFPYTQEELHLPLVRTALESGIVLFERP
ncbi:nucleotidyltransferase domain-containing protein [Ammonifex thiophilus]|uniref:Nucleotidyltransferase domain-containing protein n=1 Tax=Ammonifex thiophilus TaxID=444093 RepID=A0A3D8P2Z8_9THEO|nr:nucleotidyltransferase domain-containing protein [Ammonifex thiophilus]RDV81212.1 nucleotidyltransferase domain-containing protein [Ammonifex thiophilus]